MSYDRLEQHALLRALRVAVSSAIALATLVACGDGNRTQRPSAGTPFELVDSVQLGQTADDIRRIRPRVHLNPYIGFSETIDGTEFIYWFPARAADERGVRGNAQVDYLLAWRRVVSATEARRIWDSTVVALRKVHGVPTLCRKLGGASPGVMAVWRRSQGRLEVSARDALSTGAELLPHRVVFVLTSRTESAPRSDEERFECPASAPK